MLKRDLTVHWSGSFEISASDVGLSSTKFSEIQVTLSVNPMEGATKVTMGVYAKVLLECDRTLSEFLTPVSNSHEIILYRQRPEPPEDGRDNDLIEQIELDPGQRIYDLTDVTRDMLMLAIPARNVAPEAEELQIQTTFGAPEPEIDQRWSALLAIREELAHK